MSLQTTTSKQAAPKRPLLKTKLFMPRSRPDTVERPRLIERLHQSILPDGAILPKLTLITAPAGYGKTTLATQWINQLNSPIAWLSLDANDNDLARWMAYLFAAIATVQEEIGETALSRLTTTYLYNEPEAILTALLNDIAVCPETVILALDDYHLIHNDQIHQLLAFILQHAPVQLHLIITSRSEPPLPLAHLRAQNALNWLTARDLRFTLAEAEQFLQHTMRLNLSAADILALDEQVEGWVTGLQLAGLALQEGVPLPQATSGNARYLVDYLAEQVFDNLPQNIQDFLLRTAVLDRFCADLCDALLLDGQDSSASIRYLETANLFLIPLDSERTWYRYHHLFNEFLFNRLEARCQEDAISDLYHRSAQWHFHNDLPLVAVEFALKANDYPLAATIIREIGHEVLMFGEGLTLRQWIENLPVKLHHNDPRLALFYVWALIRTGDYKQAKTILKRIADQGQLNTPLLWGEWSALRARLAVMTGDTDVNIHFSNKALSKLPADQHMLRSEVAINLGFSHLQQANIPAARSAFAEAAQNTAHDPGLWAVMFATFYWGQTYERELQLSAAHEVYQRGLDRAVAQQVVAQQANASTAVGFMHIGLGKLMYEWNRLGEAEMHLRRALECAERSGDHKMLIYARESLAQLYVALDDWASASQLLDDLELQTRSPGRSLRRATLAMQQGDLTVGQAWLEVTGIRLTDTTEQIEEWPTAFLTLAKLRLAQRNFAHIETVLSTLENFAINRNSERFLVQVLLTQTLYYAKQGQTEAAQAHLCRAVILAEPAGLKRTFLDICDPTLNRLLHVTASRPVAGAYATTLLSLLSPDSPSQIPPQHPLSPRELELLRYLAQGMTNRQIAEQMIVSLNTVKTHSRRLYNKLDVNNRSQAVARGREWQLL